jgi:NitT/TauT family transport system substrate-binding protein
VVHVKTKNFRLLGAALTFTLAVGGLAACGSDDSGDSGDSGSSGGLTDVTVMAFPGQSYRLPFLAADQEGFFKNHGISFKFIDQPSNITGTQGMAATKAQVGFLSTTTQVQGAQAGQTYPFFCGGIDVLQTTLIADTDSDLPSTSDGATWQEVLQALKGKKIGIQTPVGSGLQILFAAALEEAGVSSDDVTFVNLGGVPTTVQAALQKGSVDVAQINPPGTQLLQTQGYGKPLIYMADGPDVYKNYFGSGPVLDPAWLKDNPDVAKEFCAAFQEGLAWVQDPANADDAAAILSKDTAIPEDVAKLVVTDTFGDFIPELDNDTMQATFDGYVDLGIAKPDPAPTTDDLVVTP